MHIVANIALYKVMSLLFCFQRDIVVLFLFSKRDSVIAKTHTGAGRLNQLHESSSFRMAKVTRRQRRSLLSMHFTLSLNQHLFNTFALFRSYCVLHYVRPMQILIKSTTNTQFCNCCNSISKLPNLLFSCNTY